MLYHFLHFPAKIALLIWCKHLQINKREILKIKGPLLIAANHPNSFLDAILLCSLFKQPIYSLARGDAFKNGTVAKLLRALKMFPVYRVSEGVENLEENYSTFKDCIDIFKQNGIILIFSEGKCINEWHLRPLKKGTARLALDAWQQGIALQVIPLGINYHSFTSFGKIIQLNFGEIITKENVGVSLEEGFGTKISQFNNNLKTQLQSLVIEIKKENKQAIENHFNINSISIFMKILLFLPAIVGYFFHAPLYIPIKLYAFKKFSKIDHYDSVVVGLLFILYPFYLFAIVTFVYFFSSILWALLAFIVLPFCAWGYVRVKDTKYF